MRYVLWRFPLPGIPLPAILPAKAEIGLSIELRTMETTPRQQRIPIAGPIMALLGLGLALFGWAGWPWMAWPARLLSADGTISSDYVRLLANSQTIFGLLLVLASILETKPLKVWRLARQHVFHGSNRSFAMLVAGLAAGMAAFAQWVVFDNIPHVTDAISHLFQAKILAAGMVKAPLPPCHEHFAQINVLMTRSGFWFAPYPPGHALTLLPFVRIGARFLFGPLLAALTCLAFAMLARLFFSATTARLASVLLALSPLFALIGGSFMSHTSFLFYAVLMVLLLALAERNHAARGGRVGAKTNALGFLAGLAFGMATLTRPQDAFLLALFVGAGILVSGRAPLFAVLKLVPAMALGLLLPAGIQLAWNRAIYGDWLAVGYGRTQLDLYYPLLLSRMGFHAGYTFQNAVRQFAWGLFRFDQVLFGWTGGLLVLLPALVLPRPRRIYWLAGLSVALVLGFYFFCDYYAFEFEARYFSAALPGAALLAAGTLAGLKASFPRSGPFLRIALVAGSLHAFAFYWPQYLWPRYARDYESATPAIRAAAEKTVADKALVLIRGADSNSFAYSAGFVWNDPRLQNRIIYGRDLPAKRACLREHFPARTLYWAEYDVVARQARLGRLEPAPAPP